jgi:hypothetical protein
MISRVHHIDAEGWAMPHFERNNDISNEEWTVQIIIDGYL